MKVAEALLVRRELQKRVVNLQERIGKNTTVQEGDAPEEEPEALIRKAFVLLQEEASLVRRINRTNMGCMLPEEMTMMEALARRDRLINEQAVLKGAVESTYREPRNEFYDEYESWHDSKSVQELKWVNLVNVAALQERIEALGTQLTRLNAAIQETNWVTELEE